MGGSSWSDDHYSSRVDDRIKSHTPVFKHDDDVRTGKSATALHPKLDPKGVTRESRDSAAHPNSVAIGFMFDVTGSMATVPGVLQKKLPQLMGLLLRKGYVTDPQVLFGAIGDAYSDKVPLQVGQFESGIEMDDDIGNIYLEGNGGGQNKESYELGLYFFARHTSIDCYEKRGHKGYLFLTGDEEAYHHISKDQAKKVFGDTIEADIPLEQIVEEVKEKYHVFFLIPGGASHTSASWLKTFWEKTLGPENVVRLDQPDQVCEAVGAIIGMIEGNANPDDIAADLKTAGVAAATATSVAKALDPLAKSTALARTGTGTGSALPEKKGRSASSERL